MVIPLSLLTVTWMLTHWFRGRKAEGEDRLSTLSLAYVYTLKLVGLSNHRVNAPSTVKNELTSTPYLGLAEYLVAPRLCTHILSVYEKVDVLLKTAFTSGTLPDVNCSNFATLANWDSNTLQNGEVADSTAKTGETNSAASSFDDWSVDCRFSLAATTGVAFC